MDLGLGKHRHHLASKSLPPLPFGPVLLVSLCRSVFFLSVVCCRNGYEIIPHFTHSPFPFILLFLQVTLLTVCHFPSVPVLFPSSWFKLFSLSLHVAQIHLYSNTYPMYRCLTMDSQTHTFYLIIPLRVRPVSVPAWLDRWGPRISSSSYLPGQVRCRSMVPCLPFHELNISQVSGVILACSIPVGPLAQTSRSRGLRAIPTVFLGHDSCFVATPPIVFSRCTLN